MKFKFKLLVIALLCFAAEVRAAQVVNVESVIDDFINNPIKASQVWDGQEIYASGEIAEIMQAAKRGEFVVRIKGGRTSYLDCYLAPEALSAAADLAKGQTVNIRGVISGFEQQRDSIIAAYNIVRLNNSVLAAEPEIKQVQQAEAESKETEQAQEQDNRNYNEIINNLYAKYNNEENNKPRGNVNVNNNNYEENLKLYQEAAEQGSFIAQNNLGVYYRDGLGAAKDLNEAERYFKLSAEKNYAPAQYNLGLLYYNENNLDEAAKYFKLAADNGDSRAMVYLGFMAYNAKNYRDAAVLYRRAAEDNNPEGFNNLAALYLNGQGVDKNLNEAMKLYAKAAELGLNAAKYNLGSLYLNNKDYDNAAKWLKAAAEGDENAAALNDLGYMYEMGLGVNKNYIEAVKYYRKAAAKGYAVAMFNLGEAYSSGTGVVQDKAQAADWYRKAASKGYKPAQDALDKLNKLKADNNSQVKQVKKVNQVRPVRVQRLRLMRKGVVAGDIVNIRSEPDESSSDNVVRKLKNKAVINVLAKNGGWYFIRTEHGIEGWMSAQYIKLI